MKSDGVFSDGSISCEQIPEYYADRREVMRKWAAFVGQHCHQTQCEPYLLCVGDSALRNLDMMLDVLHQSEGCSEHRLECDGDPVPDHRFIRTRTTRSKGPLVPVVLPWHSAPCVTVPWLVSLLYRGRIYVLDPSDGFEGSAKGLQEAVKLQANPFMYVLIAEAEMGGYIDMALDLIAPHITPATFVAVDGDRYSRPSVLHDKIEEAIAGGAWCRIGHAADGGSELSVVRKTRE